MSAVKNNGLLSDDASQKKPEEILRQIQLIVDNSYDAIIGETLEGVITSWNGGAERMFGYSAAEVVGQSISFLLPPEIKDEMPVLLNKIKNKEVIVDYDSVRLCKDGSRIDVALSGSPIKTVDGTVIGVSIVERDITERKKFERHIKDLNEVRSKFIEIISHQLRTPLTAVNWNLETFLKGSFGKVEDTQRKFLQATYISSIEITHRINILLTAIDVEEGRVRYITEEVDFDNLCSGVVKEVLKKAELKNLALTYLPSANKFPAVSGDGEKIRMVLTILMENAIAYTKDLGKITVNIKLEERVVRFEVVDSGVGIPQTEQNRIFTRFFRASNASIMQPDAFGLGLFIAKNFIEQHRGKIGFKSQEGKGSVFWFELPLKN